MLYDQEKAGAGRLLGLDIVDWSMLSVAIGLTALLKAMHINDRDHRDVMAVTQPERATM